MRVIVIVCNISVVFLRHSVSVLQSLIIVSICCGFVVQQMEPMEFEPYNC